MAEKNEDQVEDRGDDFTPPEEKTPEIVIDEAELEGLEGFVKVEDEPDPKPKDDDEPAQEEKGAIPKARLDAEIIKRKETEAENERLKVQLAEKNKPDDEPAQKDDDEPAAPEPGSYQALRAELKETRKLAREALLDGETDTFDELTDKADELVEQIAEQKAREVTTSSKNEADLAASLNKVASAAYEKYPFLDVGNAETVDQDAVSLVINRRNELIQGGMSQPEALQKAIDEKAPKFAKIHGLVDNDGKETDAAKATREAREKAAREKNADASITQPTLPKGSEKEATFKIDVKKLSDKEFENTPESVKAKLRGDIL